MRALSKRGSHPAEGFLIIKCSCKILHTHSIEMFNSLAISCTFNQQPLFTRAWTLLSIPEVVSENDGLGCSALSVLIWPLLEAESQSDKSFHLTQHFYDNTYLTISQ